MTRALLYVPSALTFVAQSGPKRMSVKVGFQTSFGPSRFVAVRATVPLPGSECIVQTSQLLKVATKPRAMRVDVPAELQVPEFFAAFGSMSWRLATRSRHAPSAQSHKGVDVVVHELSDTRGCKSLKLVFRKRSRCLDFYRNNYQLCAELGWLCTLVPNAINAMMPTAAIRHKESAFLVRHTKPTAAVDTATTAATTVVVAPRTACKRLRSGPAAGAALSGSSSIRQPSTGTSAATPAPGKLRCGTKRARRSRSASSASSEGDNTVWSDASSASSTSSPRSITWLTVPLTPLVGSTIAPQAATALHQLPPIVDVPECEVEDEPYPDFVEGVDGDLLIDTRLPEAALLWEEAPSIASIYLLLESRVGDDDDTTCASM